MVSRYGSAETLSKSMEITLLFGIDTLSNFEQTGRQALLTLIGASEWFAVRRQ